MLKVTAWKAALSKITRIALVSVIAVNLTSGDSGSSGASATPGAVVLAGGNPAGWYYKYALALRFSMRKNFASIGVLSSSGSVENLELLASGRASVAFASTDVAMAALEGHRPFREPMGVRAIARLYDNYVHLVVAADSPVHSVADLRGRPIAIGDFGSGTRLVADRILAADGIGPRETTVVHPKNLPDLVAGLRSGRIAAFVWSGGIPSDGMTALARVMPIRFLSLSAEADRLRAKYGPAYRTGTIPSGSYRNVPPALTVAVPNLLVTTTAADDEYCAYLTRALFAHQASLTERIGVAAQLDAVVAVYTEPIPLHAGALHYYRSIKPSL